MEDFDPDQAAAYLQNLQDAAPDLDIGGAHQAAVRIITACMDGGSTMVDEVVDLVTEYPPEYAAITVAIIGGITRRIANDAAAGAGVPIHRYWAAIAAEIAMMVSLNEENDER